MTTLIGVVVDGTGYLAADRLQTLGNASTVVSTKILKHPGYKTMYYAAAGAPMLTYPAGLVEPSLDGDHVAAPDARWSDKYMAKLRDLGRPPLDQNDETDGNLLVLTRGAVTLIGGTGWPSPIGDAGIALGSGGDFALGAFHAYRESSTLTVEESLSRAVMVAARLNSAGTGGGVDVVAL